jgi:imidazole glycerol-phosphate synthase subunit HisH
MARICIVDYGVGNMHSAIKGLRCFCDDVVLSEDQAELASAAALVLPGQGAFAAGMEGLRLRGLLDGVKRAADEGKPILGICLGAQLLLEKGLEFGEWDGLALLPGDVVPFPPLEEGAKTPHMGWSAIEESSPNRWRGTVLEGLPPEAEMYFIHSYILQPRDTTHVLATTQYGGFRFPSVIGKEKIVGCQFHPEKSAKEGLKIIENFVRTVTTRGV